MEQHTHASIICFCFYNSDFFFALPQFCFNLSFFFSLYLLFCCIFDMSAMTQRKRIESRAMIELKANVFILVEYSVSASTNSIKWATKNNTRKEKHTIFNVQFSVIFIFIPRERCIFFLFFRKFVKIHNLIFLVIVVLYTGWWGAAKLIVWGEATFWLLQINGIKHDGNEKYKHGPQTK